MREPGNESLSVEHKDKKEGYPFEQKRLTYKVMGLYFEGLGSNFHIRRLHEDLEEARKNQSGELAEVETMLASPEVVKRFTDWVAELDSELNNLESRIKEFEGRNRDEETDDEEFDWSGNISDLTNYVIELGKALDFMKYLNIPVPQAALDRYAELEARYEKI